jgi:PleD family two-component response regulator
MVTCIKPPDDLDDIIKTADRLMYKAKNRGKNSICHEMYSPEVIPGPFST